MRPDIAEQLSLHAQLPLDLNATSPLERNFDMVPNCPLIRARLNVSSQPWALRCPWRPTGRPLRRRRTVSAFCFPLIRAFTMKVHNAARARLVCKLLALTANG